MIDVLLYCAVHRFALTGGRKLPTMPARSGWFTPCASHTCACDRTEPDHLRQSRLFFSSARHDPMRKLPLALMFLTSAGVASWLVLLDRQNRLHWDHWDVVKPGVLYRSGQLTMPSSPRPSRT